MQDQSWNYKAIIKERVRELSHRTRNPITLRKVALHLEMQYTYLSRLLNSENEHLKEDALFEALKYLEFSEARIEMLMNARILQGSTSPERREMAAKKLSRIKGKRFAEATELADGADQRSAESAYLLDPLATIVLVALSQDQIRKDPRMLMGALRLNRAELLKILETIENAGYIQRGDGAFEVKKLISPKLHFLPDHHFVRLHQQMVMLLSLQYLQRTHEHRKKVFMVTFTAGEAAFAKIEKAFNDFLELVEQLSSRDRADKVYQLNFQLFDWL